MNRTKACIRALGDRECVFILAKRGCVTLEQALQAVDAYLEIPLRFVEVELAGSLELANEFGIYAYDAYLLRCTEKYRLPLLMLDKCLIQIAKNKGLSVLEVAE